MKIQIVKMVLASNLSPVRTKECCFRGKVLHYNKDTIACTKIKTLCILFLLSLSPEIIPQTGPFIDRLWRNGSCTTFTGWQLNILSIFTFHRIIESTRLQKTLKIIKPSHQPSSTKSTTKSCPEALYPCQHPHPGIRHLSLISAQEFDFFFFKEDDERGQKQNCTQSSWVLMRKHVVQSVMLWHSLASV